MKWDLINCASASINHSLIVTNSVVSKMKLGLGLLGFGSSFWAKKFSLAYRTLQKSSAQFGLLYYFKNQVTLKNKKWADWNIFTNFLSYNPEDINKCVFF